MEKPRLHLATPEVCEAHAWPDAGLTARLVLEMRRRQGLRACKACIERAGRPAPPKQATRTELVAAAESRAAHAAIMVFFETLQKELATIDGPDTPVHVAMGQTEHVHYAVLADDERGGEMGAVRYTFRFFNDPAAVATVLELMGPRE